MSKIAFTPNASGTGTFTLASPATNTDRTLTLPDVTTTLVGTDATQTLTNKTIASSQLTGALPAISGAALTGLPVPAQLSTASGSAPSYSCRAWINFNGTASTIRNSGNVSTLVKNGTGNYTINFSTAMPTADYAVCVGGNLSIGGTETRKLGGIGVLARTTTSFSIITGATHAVSIEDYAEIDVMIMC